MAKSVFTNVLHVRDSPETTSRICLALTFLIGQLMSCDVCASVELFSCDAIGSVYANSDTNVIKSPETVESKHVRCFKVRPSFNI